MLHETMMIAQRNTVRLVTSCVMLIVINDSNYLRALKQGAPVM